MKKLYRSKEDRKIAGICGGIGETYDIDTTLVRLAFVLVALLTVIGSMIIFYIIAWIVIPDKAAKENVSGGSDKPDS